MVIKKKVQQSDQSGTKMLKVPDIKPQTLPSTGSASATGNPRNKVALKPGRSLMDWIRLGHSGRDLTGVGGPGSRRAGITVKELANHNTEQDAWIAVRGKVYNVTPYFEFHPGGIPELLRGIGEDATQLFDEVHRWVNVESMLAKCYIGKLIPDEGVNAKAPKGKVSGPTLSVPQSPTLTLKPSDKTELSFTAPPPATKPPPRYEWFQTDDTVTLVIYTRWKHMRHEYIVINKTEELGQRITVHLDEYLYNIHLKLEAQITSDYKVNVSRPSGKVEVTLVKHNAGHKWTKLGDPLEHHNSYTLISKSETVYQQCQVVTIEAITHDTNLYCIRVPEGSRVCVPLGHHVHIKDNIHDMEISRSYTAVIPSLESSRQDREQQVGRVIYLMIKIYPDGVLTPNISRLKLGDHVEVSNPEGVFDPSFLENTNHVTLCAAGTGFTPMVGLLHYMLSVNVQIDRKVVLLFFNKTADDIFWRKELSQLEYQCDSFQVHHILSQPNGEWTGQIGRIRSELVKQFINQPSEGCKVCICGPTPFTEETIKLVKEYGYKDEMIHTFVGGSSPKTKASL